jgi:alanine dehydrogenase
MVVGILKEPQQETRVSLLPEGVAQLTKKGITVLVEPGAGIRASASDEDYEKAGARIVRQTSWHELPTWSSPFTSLSFPFPVAK